VDEAVKKVPQKPPTSTPQAIKPKPELKISKEKNNSNKEYESIKKTHESSLEKRKQIDQKRGHLPAKV
jgi:hypothetical protein